MPVLDIFRYGVILGFVEIIFLIISTFGLNSKEMNGQVILNVIIKFFILNIVFVAILDKVV